MSRRVRGPGVATGRHAKARRPRQRTSSFDQVGVGLLIAVAVALPLAFDPASELPFPIAKAAILAIAAYLIAATIVLKVAWLGASVIPRTWLLFPTAIFMAILCAASIFAVDTTMAIWGAYDRRLGLAASVQLAIVFAGAVMFVRSFSQTAAILLAGALGGALSLAYAIVQRFGLDPVRWGDGATPVFATFGNSNIMGHYFAVLAATAFAAALTRLPTAGRWRPVGLLGTACAAFTLGTILSGARSALLGLGVGVAVATVLWGWTVVVSRRRRVLLAAAGIGALGLALLILLLTPAGPRIAALSQGTDLSVIERALLYQTVLEIVASRPLLGIGPDNLAAVYNANRPIAALQFGQLVTQSSAHGWPWRVVLDGGLAGLLAFGGVLVALGGVARRLHHSQDWRGPVLLTAVLTYLSAGFFSVNDLGTDWLFWLAAGLLVAATLTPQVAQARRSPGWRVAMALVIALGVAWPVAAMARDVGSSRALRASRALATRDAPSALHQARRAVSDDGRWPSSWNALGLRALEAGDRDVALSAFTRASELGSFDPLIWANLGTLQAQLARQRPMLADAARQSALRATLADPRNPVAHAGAAQIHLVLGDGAAAGREAEAALELTPGNVVYMELAARAHIQNREADRAIERIQAALRTHESLALRILLARAYILQDNYAGARAELGRALQLESGNAEATMLLQQLDGR